VLKIARTILTDDRVVETGPELAISYRSKRKKEGIKMFLPRTCPVSLNSCAAAASLRGNSSSTMTCSLPISIRSRISCILAPFTTPRSNLAMMPCCFAKASSAGDAMVRSAPLWSTTRVELFQRLPAHLSSIRSTSFTDKMT